MFEKEAEKYAECTKTEKELEILNTVHDWGQESLTPEARRLFEGIRDRERARERGFKDGAEFVYYNKANEWHFTNRNEYHLVIDCPKGEENKLYLLLLNSRDSKEYEFGRKVPVVCYWNEEWCRFERLEHTIGERNVNKNDINAWKEIILPELKENE